MAVFGCCSTRTGGHNTMVKLLFFTAFLGLLGHVVAYQHKPKVQAFFQGVCDESNVCHQKCTMQKPGGYICECNPGYRLHENGFSCEEIIRTTTLMPDYGAEEELAGGASYIAEDGDEEGDELVPSEDSLVQNGDEDEADLPKDDGNLTENMVEGNEEPDTDKESPYEQYLKKLAWDDVLRTKYTDADNVMLGDAPAATDEDDEETEGSAATDDVAEDDLENLAEVAKRRENRNRNPMGSSGNSRGRKNRRRKGKGGRQGKNRQGSTTVSGYDIYGHQADSAVSKAKNNEVLPEAETNDHNGGYTVGPYPKYRSCKELFCKGGGKCVPDQYTRGGVRCQCKLGTAGDYCEKDQMVRYPKFMGSGYIAFPVLRGAYRSFTITVEFRSDTGNGLLLFSGENPDARADFFSVSLVDGHVEFRFDCGTGMVKLTTKNKVELPEWNRVTIQRSDWNGWVQLNDGPQASGRSKGLFSRITFREDLYLGGYRNLSMIGQRTGMNWGFVGCVKHLMVNNKNYDMRKGAYVGDAIHGVDVGECSSDVCQSTKCQNGGTCIADSADSSMCLCPIGSAGDRCENRLDIHVPAFNGNSYLQFIGLRRTVLSFAEIKIVFKPTDKDGLIFYNGFTADRTGDFIALSLRDGYIEYRFDLGTGPAIIRSRQPISMNEWHEVKFSRTGRNGYLEVDKQTSVEGIAKGGYTQLTLTLDLFVGGHRNYDEVAAHAHMLQSFQGCIQKVEINGRLLKLLEEAITGVNIENCNHPCVGQPCLNGGQCNPIKDIYTCICPFGFENTNCEDRVMRGRLKRERWLDQLGSTRNATGKARYRYYRYRRDIREPILVPMFSGDSYLVYNDSFFMQSIMKDTNRKVDIQMRIRPVGPDGLLFWVSQNYMGPSSDYLALGLKDGHAQFGFNLGDGEVVIRNNGSRLDDGRWHRIRIRRENKRGWLEVDGNDAVEGEVPGKLHQLNIDNSIIYLGGIKDVWHSTLRKYSSGFRGCISNVTLASDHHLNLIDDAEDGSNIKRCS